jgi:HSP20 family protein
MLTVKKDMFPVASRLLKDDWNSMLDWKNHQFSNAQKTLPAVNIQEHPDKYVLEMMIPGFLKEDLKMEISNQMLMVRGEAKQQTEGYTHKEFALQSFERTFNLNHQIVDASQIEAKHENGILTISIPKREEAQEKPPREIQIS